MNPIAHRLISNHSLPLAKQSRVKPRFHDAGDSFVRFSSQPGSKFDMVAAWEARLAQGKFDSEALNALHYPGMPMITESGDSLVNRLAHYVTTTIPSDSDSQDYAIRMLHVLDSLDAPINLPDVNGDTTLSIATQSNDPAAVAFAETVREIIGLY